MQAVCDYRGIFLDVDCRWPGSSHDAKVFANSSISNQLRNGTLPKTPKSLLPGYDKVPNYLIGDPAYPLTPTCMKEYDSCKDNAEVIFNTMLRYARNPIECAFGRLKARWKVLTKQNDMTLSFVPTLVMACFVLHNFCEWKNTYLDEEAIKAQIELNKTTEKYFKNIPDPVYSSNTAQGNDVRQVLKSYINQNLPDSYE